MKMPASVQKAAARFDNMTLRERTLVTAAALAGVLMIWMLSFMDPINSKRRNLADEMSALRTSIDSVTMSMDEATADPGSIALAKEKKLQVQLDEVNAKLAATSAGLIPPQHMVQVIRDVLDRQHAITLVSLHNKPVTDLIEPAHDETAGAPPPESTGPYMHPVELVLEGRYLDVLTYLKALEALPWRFYWKVLELRTTEYPINRVRVELGTLSMDKEWLGV